MELPLLYESRLRMRYHLDSRMRYRTLDLLTHTSNLSLGHANDLAMCSPLALTHISMCHTHFALLAEHIFSLLANHSALSLHGTAFMTCC